MIVIELNRSDRPVSIERVSSAIDTERSDAPLRIERDARKV